MRRKMPPLNAIRTFEAVARNLSFRKASEELFVTEPAVSRAIRILEEHFQTRLFDRLPKGLELTLEGKVLLQPVTDALNEIGAASEKLYRAHDRQRLSILTTPYVSAHWLVTKLGDFLSTHPELDVELINTIEFENIMSHDFDVAIWWGEGEWESYHSDPVFQRHLVPACNRSLGEELGINPGPSALDRLTLLHEFDYQFWEQWLQQASFEDVNAARGVVFSNYNSLYEAVVHGLGIALLVHPFLSAGRTEDRLLLPFGTDIGIEVTYHVVYPRTGQLKPEASDFVDYILKFAEI